METLKESEVAENIHVTKESQALAKEFLEPFQQIVKSRRELAKAETDLQTLILDLTAKFEALANLKVENMQLEREVLTKLKETL